MTENQMRWYHELSAKKANARAGIVLSHWEAGCIIDALHENQLAEGIKLTPQQDFTLQKDHTYHLYDRGSHVQLYAYMCQLIKEPHHA